MADIITRRVSNGERVHMISRLAMRRGPSADFCGYWHRHFKGLTILDRDA